MDKFRLLTAEEFKNSYVMDKAARCKPSDFAVVLGATSSSYSMVDWTLASPVSYSEGNSTTEVYHVSGSGRLFSLDHINLRNRLAIRPVLSYETLPSDAIKNEEGLLEVEYGEYPQNVVDASLEHELDWAFQSNKMVKTGKTYTTDSRIRYSERKFRPLKYVEYMYNGKRYIRIKEKYEKHNGDYIYSVMLSNHNTYFQSRYIWIEVSPIKWLVDDKLKILISKNALLGGLQFDSKKQYDGVFENTEIYKFLNTYFAKDIISTKVQEEKEEEKGEAKEATKPENKSKTESLIEEIYEYCKDLPNGDELTKKIDELADEYNEKLTKIYELKKKEVPTLETLSAITNELELKLNMILDDLKQHHEKYKAYFEMIDIINEYIDVVNGSEKESNNELTADLNTIISVCIPFLKAEDGNKLKTELLTILNNQKQEIMNYLHTSSIFNHTTPNKELKYGNVDEMNLDLRKKLHPLLKDLSTSVNKRDIELEIKESMTKIINGLYSEPKNKLLSYYLSEINDTYTRITNLLVSVPKELQTKYKEKIRNIMASEIDYNENFITISKNLMKIWLSLNKVESELEELEVLKTSYIDTSKFKK